MMVSKRAQSFIVMKEMLRDIDAGCDVGFAVEKALFHLEIINGKTYGKRKKRFIRNVLIQIILEGGR